MLEVASGIAHHPEAFHDPPGTPVDGGREGNDFLEAEGIEAIAEGGPRPFRGVTASPLISGESPSHLHCRRERSRKRRRPKTDIPDEALVVEPFHRPEAVAELTPPPADQFDESLGALFRVRLGEEFHDLGVGIDRDEWVQVRIPPLAETQPLSDEDRKRGSRPNERSYGGSG